MPAPEDLASKLELCTEIVLTALRRNAGLDAEFFLASAVRSYIRQRSEENLDELSGTPLVAWLIRVARNKYVSAFRHAQYDENYRRRAHEKLAAFDTDSHTQAAIDAKDEIAFLLSVLTGEERIVFTGRLNDEIFAVIADRIKKECHRGCTPQRAQRIWKRICTRWRNRCLLIDEGEVCEGAP